MNRIDSLKPEFVEFMPEVLQDGVLYISMQYGTVIHNCCCGCKGRAVTPLSPTDWKLRYDGVAISLEPSVGNWSFACQSHYWIRNNKIKWSSKWTEEDIQAGRENDRQLKKKQFEKEEVESAAPAPLQRVAVEPVRANNIWRRMWRYIRRF